MLAGAIATTSGRVLQVDAAGVMAWPHTALRIVPAELKKTRASPIVAGDRRFSSTVASPVYLSPGVAGVGRPEGGSALHAATHDRAVAVTRSDEESAPGVSMALLPTHPPVVPANDA